MKTRPNRVYAILALILFAFVSASSGQYFPPSGSWESRSPADAGFNKTALEEAVSFAVSNESKAPRDQKEGQARTFGREPFGEPIGPFKVRGDATGLVIRNGYIVAKWGDPMRIDMSHSVTKSFLTATVGLAFDRGIIRDLDAPVYKEMGLISVYREDVRYDRENGGDDFLELFQTENNRKINWDSLLRQTSDWEGSLWGKPDWADRPARDSSTWKTRERNTPGEVFEYNDVRVNLLALVALNVIREPLPGYLHRNLMKRIGASNRWRWHGYENSYVLIDGRVVQSVSGGGHWGGGMFIDAYDMARFGLLVERDGKWGTAQVLSRTFLKKAETPTKARETYGFMNFFLNTEQKLYPSAPEGTIAFLGNGTNMVFIDRKNDLVIVARWIQNSKIDEFLGKIYAAMNSTSKAGSG